MLDHSEPDFWYSLRVKSRHEKLSCMHLSGRGYTVFPALAVRRVRRSDRYQTVDVPLFPGYVFCRLDPDRRLPVLTAPGVVHILGTECGPTAIPESEIAAIQAVIQSGLPVHPWPYLGVNQRVVVEGGALDGIEGVVVRLNKGLRIIVSVNMLQRSVAVEVDRAALRPLAS